MTKYLYIIETEDDKGISMETLEIILKFVTNLILLYFMIKVARMNHDEIKGIIVYEKIRNKTIEKKRKLNHARPLIWRG